MDAVFDICYLSADGNNAEPDDIPKTKESVWVLGKKYSAVQGMSLTTIYLHNNNKFVS